VVGPRRLGSPEPFGFLCREVQQHMKVGDVGHLVGIGEARATRCRHDDAVEDVQLGDLQHMLDGAELLATRTPRDLPTRQLVPTGRLHPGVPHRPRQLFLWHGT
jgi:hypothetical protein